MDEYIWKRMAKGRFVRRFCSYLDGNVKGHNYGNAISHGKNEMNVRDGKKKKNSQ